MTSIGNIRASYETLFTYGDYEKTYMKKKEKFQISNRSSSRSKGTKSKKKSSKTPEIDENQLNLSQSTS